MTTFLIGLVTVIFIITLIAIKKESKNEIEHYKEIALERCNLDLDFEIGMLEELIQDLNKHIDTLYNRQLKEKYLQKIIELEEIRHFTNPTK